MYADEGLDYYDDYGDAPYGDGPYDDGPAPYDDGPAPYDGPGPYGDAPYDDGPYDGPDYGDYGLDFDYEAHRGDYEDSNRGDYSDYLEGYGAYEPKYGDHKRGPHRNPVPFKPLFEPEEFLRLLNKDDFNNRELLAKEMAEFGDGASKFGKVVHTKAVPHTSYHDFRDYDPYFYGVSPEERFADCKWPKDLFRLHTPEY